MIVKDAEDSYRCYFAGEIQRPEPTPPPIIVSAWQFRKALNHLGLRAQVDAAIAASNNQDLIDGWLTANEFWSTDEMVIGMAATIGKREDDLLQVFRYAETLVR